MNLKAVDRRRAVTIAFNFFSEQEINWEQQTAIATVFQKNFLIKVIETNCLQKEYIKCQTIESITLGVISQQYGANAKNV